MILNKDTPFYLFFRNAIFYFVENNLFFCNKYDIMIKVYNIAFVILICILSSCKRFDSDTLNRQMIQGKWRLVDVERKAYDSVKIDYTQQVTYLIFDGDKCTQDMVGLTTSNYRFTIHNYMLTLYVDSVFDNRLEINTLTRDSLIFTQGKDSQWTYIKMEQ